MPTPNTQRTRDEGRKKIKGYMTFRDGKLLETSTLAEERWNIYGTKAPIWQQGDKSIEVEIIIKILPQQRLGMK